MAVLHFKDKNGCNHKEKKLQVRVTTVYGNQTVYPVNEEAELFAEIAGTKTLTHKTLALAERLGYVVEIEPTTLNGSTTR